jgi:KDO2-lipid IV(A) lauroyltransferase
LPWPLRFWLADRVGDLWYRLAPTYRANVRANLSQVFGGETPERRLDELVRGVFRQNARNFTDLFRMPHWDGADFTRLVAVDDGGWALLDAARARGKGIVLVTAHLGAFDVVGQAIGARGHPMTALTGRTTARFIFDAVTHLRRGHNVVTVEATPGGVRKVVQALRRNELAGLVSDYDFFQNGLPVTLFGRETTMPPGPVRFARDTGASVVGAFARRAEKGYAIAFSGPFEVPKTRDLEADMAAGMANLAAMIEEAIASVPEQWVILQRVWPTVRPEPSASSRSARPWRANCSRRWTSCCRSRSDAPAQSAAGLSRSIGSGRPPRRSGRLWVDWRRASLARARAARPALARASAGRTGRRSAPGAWVQRS